MDFTNEIRNFKQRRFQSSVHPLLFIGQIYFPFDAAWLLKENLWDFMKTETLGRHTDAFLLFWEQVWQQGTKFVILTFNDRLGLFRAVKRRISERPVTFGGVFVFASPVG